MNSWSARRSGHPIWIISIAIYTIPKLDVIVEKKYLIEREKLNIRHMIRIYCRGHRHYHTLSVPACRDDIASVENRCESLLRVEADV